MSPGADAKDSFGKASSRARAPAVLLPTRLPDPIDHLEAGNRHLREEGGPERPHSPDSNPTKLPDVLGSQSCAGLIVQITADGLEDFLEDPGCEDELSESPELHARRNFNTLSSQQPLAQIFQRACQVRQIHCKDK